MSIDDARELADLAAAARALLDDARLRGVTFEERLPPTPAAVLSSSPPEATSSPPPPVAAPPPEAVASGASAWSAIARTSREAGPSGALALDRVRQDLGECRRCALSRGRKHIVFGVGSPEADLVVIGEGPGYQEDLQGEPFVGPAGQMLDKMLTNVLGLERSEVYILNVVKCRPPRNRNPEPAEVAACIPFLHAQIAAIRPKLLLCLGGVAFHALFGVKGIMRNRGRWRELDGIPLMPTLHPAYLLRNPDDKRLVFQDLKATRERYDQLTGRA